MSGAASRLNLDKVPCVDTAERKNRTQVQDTVGVAWVSRPR